MFLQMMIINHQRAVDIADVEQADGVNPQAQRLAESIQTSRTARITQMRKLLPAPTPTPS